jgi:hypothetical protein
METGLNENAKRPVDNLKDGGFQERELSGGLAEFGAHSSHS